MPIDAAEDLIEHLSGWFAMGEGTVYIGPGASLEVRPDANRAKVLFAAAGGAAAARLAALGCKPPDR